jgi:hypothetical protein
MYKSSWTTAEKRLSPKNRQKFKKNIIFECFYKKLKYIYNREKMDYIFFHNIIDDYFNWTNSKMGAHYWRPIFYKTRDKELKC